MGVEELVKERDHVLVAFDGPVAELPSAASTAERLRLMLGDAPLPRKVARTGDPFRVLDYAATIGPATERAVYDQLCRIEYEVTAGARIVPGVREAFATMAGAGTHITVVSSLAVAAVRAFVLLQGLEQYVQYLAARTSPDRALLPPAPHLIGEAIHQRAMPVDSCLFVGSADVDLAAARAAGVRTIRRSSTPPAAQPVAPSADSWFDTLTGLKV